MSKPMLMAMGLLFLGFCSGLGVGLFMGDTSVGANAMEKSGAGSIAEADSDNATGQHRIEENTVMANRIRELEKEMIEQKDQTAERSSDQLTYFKKYRKTISVPVLDADLKIRPEMVELLNLSNVEKIVVEKHLAEVRDEMEKLKDANIVVVKQTANSLTFDIPTDPQGKILKAKLASELSVDLGDDRSQFLLDALGSYPNDAFSGFAESKKEIEITWTQQNGMPYYTYKDGYFDPSGSRMVGWTSGASTSLSPVYKKYVDAAKMTQ